MRINSLTLTAAIVIAASTVAAQPLPPPLSGPPQVTTSPVAPVTPRAPAPWATQPLPDIAPPPPVPSAGNFDRYRFDRVADVIMRLDTASGEVSVCSQHNAGWACEAAPEGRAALDNEIARLQNDVIALKAELAALRQPPPPRPPADLSPPAVKSVPDSAQEGDVTNKLAVQHDVDRARAAVAYAWRRLVAMLVGVTNDVMKEV
jgi:hypothetical protein